MRLSDIDPTDVLRSIQDRFDREKDSSDIYKNECCIFEIPKLLHEVKEDAYTPKVVSIGILYRVGDRLRSMARFKLQFLWHFLDLSTADEGESDPGLSKGVKEKHDLVLMPYVEKIIEKSYRIGKCYNSDFSHTLLVEEVLVDSAFIIRLLIGFSFPAEAKLPFDRVQLDEIRRDLLLLENQLPLFIIHEIFNIRYPAGTSAFTFEDLVSKFFDVKLSFSRNKDMEMHFLSLVRNHYVGGFESRQKEQGKILHMVSPTVSHLHAAGVKIKVADAYNTDLLDIQFDKEKGVLTIPKLIVEDPTQSMFRNMIALEQCMYLNYKPTYITDYFYFLDCLINSQEDLELLADQGIVDNWLGSDVLCDMLNNITKGTQILPSNYTYRRLSKELNDHCNKKWNKWMATLRSKYFGQPWAGVSVIYATVLLLLTIVQVILAILALPGVL